MTAIGHVGMNCYVKENKVVWFLRGFSAYLVMTALVLGVGFGLFLLVGIWLGALLACFVSVHTQKNLGIHAVCLAALLTLILIFIPRESEKPSEDINKVYDSLFLWRISLLLLLGLSAAGSGVYFLLNHLMEARIARPFKRWTL